MPESAFGNCACLNFSGSSLYKTPELGSISPALLTTLFVLDAEAEDVVLGPACGVLDLAVPDADAGDAALGTADGWLGTGTGLEGGGGGCTLSPFFSGELDWGGVAARGALEAAPSGSSGTMNALAELLAAFEELTNNFVFGMLSAKGAWAKRWILPEPPPECFVVGLNLLGAGGSGGERDLLRCS